MKKVIYTALAALVPLGILSRALFTNQKKKSVDKRVNRHGYCLSKVEANVFNCFKSFCEYEHLDTIEFTTYDMSKDLRGYCDELEHLSSRELSIILQKINKIFPDRVYKLKRNGKFVRQNKGFVWVYEPKNIDK